MTVNDLSRRIDRIREMMAQPHEDPATLHDEVQQAVDLMERSGDRVPPDLREALNELQAEVIEQFYDNLPV